MSDLLRADERRREEHKAAEAQRLQDRLDKLHVQDRDVLFENEKFVIGVLQIVSGGATLAAIGQAEQLIKLTSDLAMRTFVTLGCIALLLAVAAAFFKHQYKMWDVKVRAVDIAAANAKSELIRRAKRMRIYLRLMRFCMWASFGAISLGLLQLVRALWLQ